MSARIHGLRALCGVGAALLALLPAARPAGAFVPKAERIVGAVAKMNRASGRAQPLRLTVELYVGTQAGGEPRGRGELVSHPQGLARLELRGGPELIERHLLLGRDHSASRNGRLLSRPRAFLPPLFLLQADSPVALSAAVRSLGGEPRAVGLDYCGDHDCFVVGDPARVPVVTADAQRGSEVLLGESRASVLPPVDAPPGTLGHRMADASTLWIDVASFEIRGMDTAEGVRYRLGPNRAFGRIRLPSWISIEEPGLSPVRFEVTGAKAVNAPAAAFQPSWLVSEEVRIPPPGLPGSTPGMDPRGTPVPVPGSRVNTTR